MDERTLEGEPTLHAFVDAPKHLPYRANVLGVGGESVTVRLSNTGQREVLLGRIHFTFSAVRHEVTFPCVEHENGSTTQREPEAIGPGKSFSFVRDLDCTMPLPGRYDVAIFATFAARGATAKREFVGAFTVNVKGGPQAPRALPGKPDLYVALAGNNVTRPLPPEAWARGDYRAVVAFINGGRDAARVGPAQISFLTYRNGSPIPCGGKSEALLFPEELPPGGIARVSTPLSCAPSEEGSYEIVGKIRLTSMGDAEIEAGRFALTVSKDPLLFSPQPWPSN